ncbi:MAG: hypothetical protein K2X74_23035, partial [Acetobacteraceae bacterium]|nr:hypothetical protein [Acetobacteraceae bacterium]
MQGDAATGGTSPGTSMTPGRPAARTLAVADPAGGLPPACDRFLEPLRAGEFFASRLWYDTLLRHALAPGEAPLCLEAGAVLLPLLRQGGALTNLATAYTLDWRPLPVPGAEEGAVEAAGRALAR